MVAQVEAHICIALHTPPSPTPQGLKAANECLPQVFPQFLEASSSLLIIPTSSTASLALLFLFPFRVGGMEMLSGI